LKPYRRNWMIGFFLIIIGLAAYLFSMSGSVYIIGVGVVVAGWSGRVWAYEERHKSTQGKA
jgi:hypothetical protein